MSKKAFELTIRFVLFTFAHLLKLSVLAAVGFFSTVTILGSYVLITVQALWVPQLGSADLLLPVKISIAVGFGFLIVDIFRRILRVRASGDVTGSLAATLELLLTVGLILALWPSIHDFLGKTILIDLGANVLPWEVRVTATFAFLLPAAFLLITSIGFVIVVMIRAALDVLLEEIGKWLSTEGSKALIEKYGGGTKVSKQDSSLKPNAPSNP